MCTCISIFGLGTYDQSGESVYTMGLCGDRLVVGTSNRKVSQLATVSPTQAKGVGAVVLCRF